eukprot:CAMPEP_0194758990 /NCGR_PEP_ID=MMETSP0323_2-20130528/12128_1 /TAXON_ID=2866 ORGANISM="Crypthecodinium cohnii, Strain Seligo" /NCGR_SAMPLE_ID=MMETSP0323_2 /ASSEMBLY_ACC=CAM_ASM_000346 /LENGTH=109 /DNA_ID=CAMNT_0039679505 /DNA_START=440 /DNA_END=767 /DNA_ORIENTATION=+
MNVCQSVCQRILLCVCVFGHEEQPGTEARCNPFPWLAEVDVTAGLALPCPALRSSISSLGTIKEEEEEGEGEETQPKTGLSTKPTNQRTNQLLFQLLTSGKEKEEDRDV